MGWKSDDNSKFEQRFWKNQFFIPQSDHDGSSEVYVLYRKIRLEQQNMTAKLHVGGQKY